MNSLRKVTSWMIWKAKEEFPVKKYNTASEGKPVILMLWLFPQQSAVSCSKLSQLLLCRGQRCQRLVSAVSAWQYCTIRIFTNNINFLILSVLYHFSYWLVLFLRSVPGLFEPGTIGTNTIINCPTVCFMLDWLYDLHKFINTTW